MKIPRLLIAGVQSGVGKTTLTLGIMAALKKKGLLVQGFKVGPDYIDTGLHRCASGIASHNLDSWMCSEEIIKTVFVKNAARADISVIEGVMGLYDGIKGQGIKGSSADIALILNIPVVLVVNARGLAQSCVALAKGYIDYEPRLNIQGIILNQAGTYHKNILKTALQDELGIKVLGCLPAAANIKIPERHLGLLPAEENKQLQSALESMAGLVEQEIDLDGLLQIAANAADIDYTCNLNENDDAGITVGVARDEAFSFYYQDSLDYMEECGAKIVFFSPLHDKSIPSVDGLYIGGGFPEMFLPQLSSNENMLGSLKDAARKGMPLFAECGGFMYLTERITDFKGHLWAGAGVIPAQVKMTDSLAALGYVQAVALKDSILLNQGATVKGHEFHYSQISGINEHDRAFSLKGGKGPEGRADGYARENVIGSYVHLHLRANAVVVDNFFKACKKYRRNSLPAERRIR